MGKNKKNQTQKSIRPGKNLVASKAESLNKKLYKIIDQGVTELTLDFVNLKTVDPVGLSVIAAAHNTLNNTGGRLLLKKVPDEINTLFDALGLNNHFNVVQLKKSA
jgi:anti-anti-sigma factor